MEADNVNFWSERRDQKTRVGDEDTLIYISTRAIKMLSNVNSRVGFTFVFQGCYWKATLVSAGLRNYCISKSHHEKAVNRMNDTPS